MFVTTKKKSDPHVRHGITLPAKPRIRRSGRSSALPCPPLQLKAYLWYHVAVWLSIFHVRLSFVTMRLKLCQPAAKTPCKCGSRGGIYRIYRKWWELEKPRPTSFLKMCTWINPHSPYLRLENYIAFRKLPSIGGTTPIMFDVKKQKEVSRQLTS